MILFNEDLRRLKYGKLSLDTFLKMIFIEKVRISYYKYALSHIENELKLSNFDISSDQERFKDILSAYEETSNMFDAFKHIIINYRGNKYVISTDKSAEENANAMNSFYRKFGSYTDFSVYSWDFLTRNKYRLNFEDLTKDKTLGLLKLEEIDLKLIQKQIY